jgi:pimeloyl-ACP methyl ester carboxylesterase
VTVPGTDDDLVRFAAEGAPDLPDGGVLGWVEREGARLWYAAWGEGPAVVLLHGGLGHSGNWGYQVPALLAAGYRVIVADTRGHGLSTRDGRPFSYQLLASDLLAVLDTLAVGRAALVGWSDGACTALVAAAGAPDRVSGVFFFGCNVDPSGTKELVWGPVLDRCVTRHRADFQRLAAGGDLDALMEALGPMQRDQPNYTASDLGRIGVPVLVAQAEGDEFIRRDHAEFLARSIPGARFELLPGVTHFAPLQRPAAFNRVVLAFLQGLS